MPFGFDNQFGVRGSHPHRPTSQDIPEFSICENESAPVEDGPENVCSTSVDDDHSHTYIMGEGRTSSDDGHYHEVVDGVVQEADGHTHQLENCSEEL